MAGIQENKSFVPMLHISGIVIILLAITNNVEAQLNYTIRLAGNGSTPYRGRVEVYVFSQWVTVCDDRFFADEAKVICETLGFSARGGNVRPTSYFGPGNLSNWQFDCGPTNTLLQTCLLDNPSQLNRCPNTEDVGVECDRNLTDGHMRVVGTPSLFGSGFVEVYSNGRWAAVCNDGWNYDAAQVVCNAEGFNNSRALPGAPREVTSVAWNNVIKNFSMTSISCTGSENSLLNCSYSSNTANCNITNSNKYATVTCVDLPSLLTSVPVPSLNCSNNKIEATFNRSHTPNLQPTNLKLASNVSCNLTRFNDVATGLITVSLAFNDCGTRNTTNATHITFENQLRYEHKYHLPAGQTIYAELVNTYLIQLRCHLDRRVFARQYFVPLTETVTQSGIDTFRMSMHLYYGNDFVTPIQIYPPRIRLNDWLSASLVLESNDPRLKLVAHNCTTNPNASRTHPVVQPLFLNKCPTLATLSFYNFNMSTQGFYFQTFKFLHYDTVCIHCDAIVCLSSEITGQCDRACGTNTAGRRRKRQTGESSISQTVVHIRSPVLYIVGGTPGEGLPGIVTGNTNFDNPATQEELNGLNIAKTSSVSSINCYYGGHVLIINAILVTFRWLIMIY